ELAGLLGGLRAQVIATLAGVRVDVAERRVLLAQLLDQRDEHGVLDHVGDTAGVEGVAGVHGAPSASSSCWASSSQPASAGSSACGVPAWGRLSSATRAPPLR